MSTMKLIVPVELSEVSRGVLRDIVGLQSGRSTVKSTPDDLLDLASVEVNAGSKSCHIEWMMFALLNQRKIELHGT
jgi:endonuclease/exonuclease/phosphatase family metal-dependent hydrolase